MRDISAYALIGDTRTAALCSSDGSIDWLCLPRFDSLPVFGRLLDARAGCFYIRPDDVTHTSRRYIDDTPVLETTWRTSSGEVRLREGMVTDVSGSLLPQALLVRSLACTGGTADVRIGFSPSLGWSRRKPEVARRSGHLVCSWGSLAIALGVAPTVDLHPRGESVVTLHHGGRLHFALSLADRSPVVFVDPLHAETLLERTREWWSEWSRGIEFDGELRDAVVRTMVTLRLLTYSPSGAPVAAPTTSLPEEIGGARNWDYRYSWPRDAAIGLASFLAVGKHEEAHSFMHWLLHASRLSRPRLDVLYTLDGKPARDERELHDVEGYRDSLPVRIGNEASRQHQLDVYGWVVDTGWLRVRAGVRLHGETWRALAGFADFVASHWREPDAGIWEVRGEPKHWVHSKLMAWVALDRAGRIARSHKTGHKRVQRWEREKRALAEQIRAEGYDESQRSYLRAYGTSDLDAALLLLPILEFDDAGSERVVGTVDAIAQRLAAGKGLVYRYDHGSDSLPGDEGAFWPCSFWLSQAFAATGRVERAVEVFQDAWERSNDVGLMSEEVDPATGTFLGNFPQAFTHATLVQAALAIRDATPGRGTSRG